VKYKKLALLCLALLPIGSVDARPHTKQIHPKKASGIYGQVVRIGFPPTSSYSGTQIPIAHCVVVIVRAADNQEVQRVTSDEVGKFKITLKPGKYLVATVTPDHNPWTPYPNWFAGNVNDPTGVTVWSGFYSEAQTVFDGGW